MTEELKTLKYKDVCNCGQCLICHLIKVNGLSDIEFPSYVKEQEAGK